MQTLTARAEAAKRALSERETVRIAVQDTGVDLDQQQFRALAEPLLARLRAPVERALRDARIRTDDIDNVVLAGGATRSPMVRQLVTRMFGRFPATDLNPDEVVAAGAAVMAGLKMKDQALNEVVMTDVCPYTLGIETVGRLPNGAEIDGQFSAIIDRNTVVPASRVKGYVPTREGQKALDLEIYQGEARLVRDNIRLGTLHVPLPRVPRDEAGVDVRFTYDVNGLLEVEALVRITGQRHRLVIQGNAGGLDEAGIAARLAELASLKVHPRDQAANRALTAQAERLFQQLLGDQREHLGQAIARFELALETQDDRRIREAQAGLRALIGHIEDDSYFAPDFNA